MTKSEMKHNVLRGYSAIASVNGEVLCDPDFLQIHRGDRGILIQNFRDYEDGLSQLGLLHPDPDKVIENAQEHGFTLSSAHSCEANWRALQSMWLEACESGGIINQ